jgi:hypothetical protein
LLPPGPKEDRLTGIIKALSLGENKLNLENYGKRKSKNSA